MSIHVGIVMDGNGRWATEQDLPRSAGHNAAMDVAIDIAKECPDIGVTTLSLYAFAIKNWKRDQGEVDHLWELFRSLFDVRVQELIQEGGRLRLLGNRAGIPADTLELIEKAEADSAHNDRLLIQIGLNYDGIDEIVRATQAVVAKVAAGTVTAESVDEAMIRAELDSKDAPDPDIIIRTGIDQNKGQTDTHVWRGSSFLQFQSAQTIGVAMTTRFPDMTIDRIKDAIKIAKLDDRLFGGQRT